MKLNDSAQTRFLGPLLLFAAFAALMVFREAIVAATIPPDHAAYTLAIRQAIAIGFWLAAAGLANRLTSVLVFDRLLTRTIGASVPRLLKDVVTFAFYAVAITLIATLVFELPLTGFWATSSAVGLVLGFALRNVILDVFTGVAINVDRPYRLGDWIEIHGIGGTDLVGRVAEINWRTTRVETEVGTTVIVPNSMFSTMVVTNFWSPTDITRLESEFTLDSFIPVDRAKRILLAAARSAACEPGFAAERELAVLVDPTPDSRIVYKVRYWIHSWRELSPSLARDRIASHVLRHLERAGLGLASPSQDLYLASMPPRQLDWKSADGRRALVAKVPLFEPLEQAEIAVLADAMAERFFPAGDAVIRRGDAGDSMFIVVEGMLDVYSRAEDNGHDVRLGHLEPGEFFGEMSLLTGELRSASVVAATDVVTYEVTKHDLDPLIRRRPQLAEMMGRVVAERHLREQRVFAADAAAETDAVAVTGLAQQIARRMWQFLRVST